MNKIKSIFFLCFVFLIPFSYVVAQTPEVTCLNCADGFMTCFTDPEDEKTFFQKKCPGYKAGSCHRAGWGRRLQTYNVYNEQGKFDTTGNNSVFYESEANCQTDRNSDLRAQE